MGGMERIVGNVGFAAESVYYLVIFRLPFNLRTAIAPTTELIRSGRGSGRSPRVSTRRPAS